MWECWKEHEVIRNTVLFQVTSEHVKEACRLLNRSIVRVEQPDVHLDEEQNLDQSEHPEPMETGDNGWLKFSIYC